MKQQSDRRHFLKTTLATLGSIFLGYAGKLFPKSQQASAHTDRVELQQVEQPHMELQERELYEGFLFLPEESLIPYFVRQARGIMLCQTSNYDDPTLAGETIQFNNIEELKNLVSFPLFTLNTLPLEIEFIGADVTRFVQSHEIWKASINFGTGNDYSQLISIHARPEFHKPFPVWPVRLPFAHDDGPINPEKISVSQKPMVLLPSISGHLFQWIEHDILYSLVVEHDKSRETAIALAESLIQI